MWPDKYDDLEPMAMIYLDSMEGKDAVKVKFIATISQIYAFDVEAEYGELENRLLSSADDVYGKIRKLVHGYIDPRIGFVRPSIVRRLRYDEEGDITFKSADEQNDDEDDTANPNEQISNS